MSCHKALTLLYLNEKSTTWHIGASCIYLIIPSDSSSTLDFLEISTCLLQLLLASAVLDRHQRRKLCY